MFTIKTATGNALIEQEFLTTFYNSTMSCINMTPEEIIVSDKKDVIFAVPEMFFYNVSADAVYAVLEAIKATSVKTFIPNRPNMYSTPGKRYEIMTHGRDDILMFNDYPPFIMREIVSFLEDFFHTDDEKLNKDVENDIVGTSSILNTVYFSAVKRLLYLLRGKTGKWGWENVYLPGFALRNVFPTDPLPYWNKIYSQINKYDIELDEDTRSEKTTLEEVDVMYKNKINLMNDALDDWGFVPKLKEAGYNKFGDTKFDGSNLVPEYFSPHLLWNLQFYINHQQLVPS
jgi:hypothetical protein